jgi:hypothetical protein
MTSGDSTDHAQTAHRDGATQQCLPAALKIQSRAPAWAMRGPVLHPDDDVEGTEQGNSAGKLGVLMQFLQLAQQNRVPFAEEIMEPDPDVGWPTKRASDHVVPDWDEAGALARQQLPLPPPPVNCRSPWSTGTSPSGMCTTTAAFLPGSSISGWRTWTPGPMSWRWRGRTARPRCRRLPCRTLRERMAPHRPGGDRHRAGEPRGPPRHDRLAARPRPEDGRLGPGHDRAPALQYRHRSSLTGPLACRHPADPRVRAAATTPTRTRYRQAARHEARACRRPDVPAGHAVEQAAGVDVRRAGSRARTGTSGGS